jgi:phytoene synthase
MIGTDPAGKQSVEQQATAVLRRHGRSFHFAGRLLAGRDLRRSARLYAFCRWLDDLVDHGHPAIARRQLEQVRLQLQGKRPTTPNVSDFLLLSRQCEIPLEHALELITGLEQDLERVRVPDWPSLVRYAYRVAGTVGLMMSRVLGARSPAARPFAVDLGIAMQLTNIARDVAEDARADRRYLPASWVGAIEPMALVDSPQRLRPACRQLLEEAERYYDSGLAGLAYLPLRARVAIGVAGRIYREIGRRLIRHGCHAEAGREVVPSARKLALTPGSVLHDAVVRTPPRHDCTLHEPLAALASETHPAEPPARPAEAKP